MPRSLWTGSISFGLVNVPVKLYSAISQKEVRFNMLHAKDGGRIHLKRFCSVEDKEVPYEEISKGYQIAKGQYVEISRDELAKFHPKATKSIDIQDFVDLEEIDPIFYEATYYLVPDKGAERAYTLLMEAMKRTKRVGVAHVVLRTKQYLCAIRPAGDALVLSTMLYADEVVPQSELGGLPDAGELDVNDRELGMAAQLIESLTVESFEPEKFHDDYRERVLALIEAKAAGEEVVLRPAPQEPPKVVDLMAALEASLAAAKAKKAQSA